MALPLDGIKVLDFCWVFAGPFSSRYLADFGATVVKVESRSRLDTLRLSPPFAGDKPGIERAGPFALWNAGKWSIALNMGHPKGVQLARRLILEWADVVTENYTAGVMERWGLGYSSLASERPDLVMLSLPNFGTGTPLATMPGYGPLMTPFTGFNHLTGWPDREPVHPGPSGSYTDFLVPRLAALAVVSALDHRARTGEGAHIEMPQHEAALQFLAPVLVEAVETDRQRIRVGNRDPGMAPHGVYPCRGEDQWLAIAVRNDADWQALCRVMGREDLARDPRYATLPGRKAHEETLDTLIAQWTRDQDADALMARLQEQGVPAGIAQANRDLLEDPHLAARGFFVELEHPLIGRYRVDGPEFKLSLAPPAPRHPSPLLGEHTALILRQALGLSDEEITALEQEGILA